MEKIYDEQSKKQKQKQIQIDGTSALSFLVAIFAIVSLVSFGISGGLNTSYALPEVTTVPTSFTGGTKASDGQWYVNGAGALDFHTGTANGQTFPVYCLQQATTFGHGSTYTKGSDITDGGLIYLLANIYPNATVSIEANNFVDGHKPGDSGMGSVNKSGQWVAQALIWKYLKDTNVSGNSNSMIDTFVNAKEVYETNTSTDDYAFELKASGTMLSSFKYNGVTAQALLTKAKTIKVAPATFTVNKEGAKTSTTNNNKYYTYGPLGASGSVADSSLGEYKGYTVAFSGSVPSGTIISNEAGTKIADGKVFTGSEKFYISIPVDSVKATTDINLSITGKFEKYTGFYYTTPANEQQVTTVKYLTYDKSDSAKFTVAPSEDTGMSSAQTIYFIGLVVLLCGVGIIYANAKPSAQKQAQQEQ